MGKEKGSSAVTDPSQCPQASVAKGSCSKCEYRGEETLKFRAVMERMCVPFRCPECKAFRFPYRAIRDIVFVWPEPPKTKSAGGIYLPQAYREVKGCGVVLAVGPGYWDKVKGKFFPTQLKVGTVVLYTKNVPWHTPIAGPDGKMYTVKYMGESDVFAVVPDEEVV